MDNQRFILFALLISLGYMIYNQWILDYGPKPPAALAGTEATPTTPDLPPTAKGIDDVATPPASSAPAVSSVSPSTAEVSASGGQPISVVTDVFRLEIDTLGGDVRKLLLSNYPVNKDEPNKPVELLTEEGDLFIAQSGLLGAQATAPTHHDLWRASGTEYRLEEGQSELRIPLEWTNPQGIKVVKTYVFKRGSYEIGLEHTITNQSAENWRGRQYLQLQRKQPAKSDDSATVRTYTGGVLYTPEKKYEKISFSDMAGSDLARKSPDGWIAMIQHYFLGAWIPPAGEENNFYTKSVGDKHFVIGVFTPEAEVKPGQQISLSGKLFAGPKLQRTLEAVAPGLDLTVDYGALTIVAKPIFWLLEQFHKIFNNWGWAIIFVTITLKALFFKLSEASYKSMANMKKLQPKLAELKEQLGSDKQKYNMAMMDLYRKEKVNPLGGCLPIIVQIPVFLALYWVLVETVEMRQAPFAMWLNDLSSKDPYFILPVIMGISMYFQQKLSPPPSDPMQAKIMQFFPLMFTGFFAFFPSGLVLYWVVNNLLSIAQQWYITRQIEKVPAHA